MIELMIHKNFPQIHNFKNKLRIVNYCNDLIIDVISILLNWVLFQWILDFPKHGNFEIIEICHLVSNISHGSIT